MKGEIHYGNKNQFSLTQEIFSVINGMMSLPVGRDLASPSGDTCRVRDCQWGRSPGTESQFWRNVGIIGAGIGK